MSAQEAEVVEHKPVMYQDYSLDRKAEVLALVEANGGNVRQTSIETGIRHATIQYWMANQHRFAQLRPQKLADLGDKLDKTVHKLIDSIGDHDLEDVPLQAKSTAFGIVFDKLQLYRGLPTSITESVERTELVCILQAALGGSEVVDVGPTADGIDQP